MQGLRLTPDAEERIESMFEPEQRETVRRMLIEECGNNLLFCEDLNAEALDRCTFDVLKLSGGDMEKLKKAVALAKQDWRDLLIAAGFANDVTQRRWVPEKCIVKVMVASVAGGSPNCRG